LLRKFKVVGWAASVITHQRIFLVKFKGSIMNWEQIQGNWKQVTGKAKEQWGKLTDDDMVTVNGRRDQLSGKLQERYGIAKEAAEEQIADWEKKATDSWFTKKS
jgi:uncharacterized protein YjbJ (UPF0337 family)